jgi:hypothetical protein
MLSLLARLPTDLALRVPLALHHQARDQCVVVCHHHQRHIMSPLAHTTRSRHSSPRSHLWHNHHSTSNNSRHSLIASRTPTMAPMLEASLRLRHPHPLVLRVLQARGRVRVRCHLTVVLPAHLRRYAPLLRTDQDLRAMDTRARTNTTLTLPPTAVLLMVRLHQLLLLLLLSRLLEIAMIVRRLHYRSGTVSGRIAIT